MWILDELRSMRESDRPAIIYRGKTITFKELWTFSEAVAFFHKKKLKTKAPIIIYGNKDIEITIAMVAALKSGRPYICVDTTFPKERVNKIAKITNAELMYNFSNIHFDENEGFFDEHTEIKTRKDFSEIISRYKYETIKEDCWVKNSDICYILFTSGSTGEPKGVNITKYNLLNFIEAFKEFFDINGQGVALNQVSYSFDISGIQFYYYLASGNTLFNIDSAMIENTSELFHYLGISSINSWVSTPSFMEMCAVYDEFNFNLLPNLSKIVLAGEVLTKKLVNKLNKKFPNAKIINGYGPSEITILTSACEITTKMLNDPDNLPIGRVIKEATYWIEEQGNSLIGNEGELIVVSDSVCKGYYKQPELTKACFFDYDGKRGYRTKDIVYKKGDMLYFKGRTDFQIKLNGYRIELEDIENNINKIDIVYKSVVVPIYQDEKISYIHAFISLIDCIAKGSLETKIYIKGELKKKIPNYMVPRKITIIDKLPINNNGKIDRKKIIEKYIDKERTNG